MVLKYRFFDKEDFEGHIVKYDFEPPFHANMDEEFKEIYGEQLTFIKELNHRDKIIRLHSAFDSGKGTKYVPPKPRKKPRRFLRLRIEDILLEKPKHTNFVLEIGNEYDEKIHLIFGLNYIIVFTGSTVNENGSVAGYKNMIDNNIGSLIRFFKKDESYPHTYKYLEFNNK